MNRTHTSIDRANSQTIDELISAPEIWVCFCNILIELSALLQVLPKEKFRIEVELIKGTIWDYISTLPLWQIGYPFVEFSTEQNYHFIDQKSLNSSSFGEICVEQKLTSLINNIKDLLILIENRFSQNCLDPLDKLKRQQVFEYVSTKIEGLLIREL